MPPFRVRLRRLVRLLLSGASEVRSSGASQQGRRIALLTLAPLLLLVSSFALAQQWVPTCQQIQDPSGAVVALDDPALTSAGSFVNGQGYTCTQTGYVQGNVGANFWPSLTLDQGVTVGGAMFCFLGFVWALKQVYNVAKRA